MHGAFASEVLGDPALGSWRRSEPLSQRGHNPFLRGYAGCCRSLLHRIKGRWAFGLCSQ